MDNNHILCLLADNIKSSVKREKPLGNWFINILTPLLLGNILTGSIVFFVDNTFLMVSALVCACLCYLYFCSIVFIRAFRVDKYINRKQQFFHIIKDYVIENNKDINNEQFLTLLNYIDIFCSVKKRLIPVLTGLCLISAVSIQVLLMSLDYFFITCLIILILLIYYMYLANNIWQEIFSMEKNVYYLLYIYLDMPEEYHVKALDIPIKYTSFIVNMFLTIISLGIYGLYWDYLFHTAPDKTFPYIHEAEEDIFNKITVDNSKNISD